MSRNRRYTCVLIVFVIIWIGMIKTRVDIQHANQKIELLESKVANLVEINNALTESISNKVDYTDIDKRLFELEEDVKYAVYSSDLWNVSWEAFFNEINKLYHLRKDD